MQISKIKEILRISYELWLSHIGSNLSCLSVLEEIYKKKKQGDIVILDNAHAGLAHLVMESEYLNFPIGEVSTLIKKYGIHCDRQAGCDASGGSLGHGLGIGIGYAISDRKRSVYVIVSDGSMHEGSNWEALRIKKSLELENLHIYANFNGYTAVDEINKMQLETRIKSFDDTVEFRYTTNGISFLNGINGHYDVLTEETYNKAFAELEYNERIARDLT